ncbi:MAG: ribulose-phosphate 3-epimerase [Candidatus Methanoplasma sp.]|jgi:ribulose-phosphate 3-epimerase|nr:ribulose-phosphate 3-epimerase [Candidatus Methanoplasma sp.]
MTKVAPSILSSDFSRLGEEVSSAEKAGADWIHIDVMDGVFVPNITIGPAVVSAIRGFASAPFDVHLMIERPSRYVGAFADAGADMITVHAEAGDDADAAIRDISDRGLKAGITLNPGTPVSSLDRYLDRVDLVLVMSVQAGFGGQSFRSECLPKIAYAREYAEAHSPGMEVSVDGGINRETGRMCADAGASVLVAGSYLFKLGDMAPEIALWKGFGGG